jgi:hypothetical protein
VVLGGQERADVAVQDEVRLDRALDRLLDLGVGLVDEVAHPLEDLALPVGQGSQVGVDPGILGVVQLPEPIVVGSNGEISWK